LFDFFNFFSSKKYILEFAHFFAPLSAVKNRVAPTKIKNS